jgi:hypothetical protein
VLPLVDVRDYQGVSVYMYAACFFPSHTTFLSRSGHSRWLLLSFILGSLLAASCSEAGDRPAAADLSKSGITLQRSACLGTCPEYKVTIHDDGRVLFTTETYTGPESAVASHRQLVAQGVALPGTHEDRIAPATVAALFARFRKAGFFNLRSSYRAEITDSPAYVLTADAGQRHKSVEDYMGRMVGMPKVVTELEDAVDKVAGTDRWVRGTAGLIAWLEGQHFDFHSPEAAQLMVSGANRRADEAMVLALIDHGAPLDSEVSIFPAYKPTPIVAGLSLMEGAIRRGLVRLFNELVADGWLDRLGRKRATEVFAQSGAGCSPAVVDAAADAGVDIDEPEPPRPNAAYDQPQGKTALANVTTSRCNHVQAADRVATARQLLARGANPNHRDSSGHNALYGVSDPDMVNLLLAHGVER